MPISALTTFPRRVRHVALPLVAALVSGTRAGPERTWAGVELVGHRSASRGEILAHVPLKIGTPYTGDREQWATWARNLESRFGFADVGVGAVRFADGRAFLVVDVVERGEEERLRYRAAPTASVPMPDELMTLHDALVTRSGELFRQGTPSREHAGAGFLDYDDEQLHELALRLVDASRGRREQLVRTIIDDADASKRATAARLLNWAGDVERSIMDVHDLVDDPDVVVRNNLTRFMLHDVARLDDTAARHAVIDTMAGQLRRPSHADRNKAVSALRQVLRAHPDDATYIDDRAGPAIDAVAAQSVLDNVGGVARWLQSRIAIEKMFVEYRRQAFPGVPDLTAEAFRERPPADAVLVDCRSDAEQATSMIPGAITRTAFEADRARYRGRPVVTYCTIGYRSGVYGRELREQSVDAMNMRGGVLGWAHAGGRFIDHVGRDTTDVHVFGDKWNLLPPGFEGVTPETAGVLSVDLFDGRTLGGWHAVGGGDWTVEQGAIVGRSSRDVAAHGLLVSDGAYGDFEVTFEYFVIEGDSGFYFRSEEVDSVVGIRGFQVEVDDVEPGGLYETAGRGWVIKRTPEDAATWHRPAAWNRVTLTAIGSTVTVTINGTRTAAHDDPEGRARGHFALQLHGGQDMHVRFRNIRLRSK